MSATLYHNSEPTRLVGRYLWAGARLVPTGDTVVVCAWCDGAQAATRAATAAGYQVSHGCCDEHLRAQEMEVGQ